MSPDDVNAEPGTKFMRGEASLWHHHAPHVRRATREYEIVSLWIFYIYRSFKARKVP